MPSFTNLTEAYEFFHAYAGYAVPTGEEHRDAEIRRENAINLATAESAAKVRGWTVEWATAGDGENPGDMVAVLFAPDQDDPLASQSGVTDDEGDPYRRVVEAELALEAFNDLEGVRA